MMSFIRKFNIILQSGYRRFSSTACKQYCLAAGATQGNIAYTQNVMCKIHGESSSWNHA